VKRLFVPVLVVILLFSGLGISAAYADGGYVVKPGDTLASIARAYGVSLAELAQTNGLSWDAWVYAGQRLTIPGQTTISTSSAGNSTYTVQPGDTLFRIALNHGVSTAALQAANGLSRAEVIYSGQTLVIPGGASNQSLAQPSPTYTNPEEARWIDVNLSTQTLTAYEGQTPVMQALVSTGIWQTPTVVGTFKIYVKYPSTRMIGDIGGDYYDLPDVPHVMYFYEGYGLHGTYWHNNFGTPMSHGCVNLSQTDAAWLYDWTSVGTKVVTHY
jgi:LysM repeat protein